MGDQGRTVVRLTYGSHLFGTATRASDLDIKGVFVPAPRDILLGRVRGSVMPGGAAGREKGPGQKNRAGDVEEELYSLQRFLRACLTTGAGLRCGATCRMTGGERRRYVRIGELPDAAGGRRPATRRAEPFSALGSSSCSTVACHALRTSPADHPKRTAAQTRSSGQTGSELAAEGQTVAVDMLFAPPSAWLGEPAPEWAEILANGHRLLTRRSKAFIGYCRQQASQYGIKGSRVAAALAMLEDAAPRVGPNANLAVLDATLRDFANSGVANGQAALVDLPQPGGGRVTHLEVCGRKLPYTVAVKEAAGIMRRVVADYGARALQAEAQGGVDWKALSHAVRIAAQGLDLLETGRVSFPAANVERIRAIKRGEVAYGDVTAEIEALLYRVEDAAGRSSRPDEVDRAWIDDFIVRTYAREVRDSASL